MDRFVHVFEKKREQWAHACWHCLLVMAGALHSCEKQINRECITSERQVRIHSLLHDTSKNKKRRIHSTSAALARPASRDGLQTDATRISSGESPSSLSRRRHSPIAAALPLEECEDRLQQVADRRDRERRNRGSSNKRLLRTRRCLWRRRRRLHLGLRSTRGRRRRALALRSTAVVALVAQVGQRGVRGSVHERVLVQASARRR